MGQENKSNIFVAMQVEEEGVKKAITSALYETRNADYKSETLMSIGLKVRATQLGDDLPKELSTYERSLILAGFLYGESLSELENIGHSLTDALKQMLGATAPSEQMVEELRQDPAFKELSKPDGDDDCMCQACTLRRYLMRRVK